MIIFTPNTVIKSADMNTNLNNIQTQLDNTFWLEIGRTTLTGTSDTISVTGLPEYRYLRAMCHIVNSGSLTVACRFNNDSGSNYSFRYFANNVGGSGLSQTSITAFWSGSYGGLAQVDLLNISSIAKTGLAHGIGINGAASNNVDSVDFWLKWVNTSTAINRIDFVNTSTGDFASGSELVVLGHN